VSRVNDIKNMKRKQRVITPSQVLAETVGEEEKETNVVLKQEINETRKEEKKVERKRVSFDLRTDLHKELKMQALLQDKNIYNLIEEALEKYLSEKK
jgi:predicted HicB family RNase H-like nuclease